MEFFIAQIILAARRSDRDGSWIQILVFVGIAAFYLIVNIVKAKRNAQQEREQLGRKPQPKPPGGIRRLQKQFPQQPQYAARPAAGGQQHRPIQQPQPRRKIARPQLVGEKLPAKKAEERAVRLPTLESLKEPELLQSTPLQEVKAAVSRPVKKLGDKRARAAAQTPQAEHLSEIVSAYADPDQLKTAILHYEILGRPLSLRDPSERIIGLYGSRSHLHSSRS